MPYQYRCYGDHDKMQDSERMRVSPILKPDHDSHHKWLDFTVQKIFREDKLTELYNDLEEAGEILPHIRHASINSDGFLSQHAAVGKFYCGQPILSCECCDILCGPTQGCNCDSCKAIQKHEMERDKDRRDCPPLMHPPKAWFWKEEITKEHLEQYLFSLEVNQRNIIHEAMKSVKSFGRLNKRIAVLGRHLAAISYQCFGKAKKEELKSIKKGASNDDKGKEKVAEEFLGYTQEVRNGIHTVLSLVSKILHRAWKRGEDADICSSILVESLDTLQKLPEAFLYNEGESPPVWNEVFLTASTFLEKVVLGTEYQNVPIEDRKKALVLLYELAFQYGTLHQMIQAVIVSINLCICSDESFFGKMPLGKILQRLRNLMKDANQILPWESELKLRCGTSDSGSSESQAGGEEEFYDLRAVTMEILRFLADLTTLYAAPSQDAKEKDTVEEEAFKHELLFWGSKGAQSMPHTPAVCRTFVEIPIKQICITETTMILLTRYQRVYSFVVNVENLIFSRLVQLPIRIQVTKIAASLDGRHFLALTSAGEVYSWGNNDHGCLGVEEGVEGFGKSPIPGLAGKHIVHIACGSSYCAAVTDEGALYTWGSGENGRLGHGSNSDCPSPTLVEKLKDQNIADVACGNGDAHTLAVTADGRIWSWGDGKFGKLGRGTEDGTSVPELIEGFGSVVRASCGLDFSVCLTEDGKVWTWGRGDCFQLGHGNRESILRPKVIDSLAENLVIDIAVGYNHVVAVTQSRLFYFWGSHEPQVTEDVAVKTPVVVGKRVGSLNFGIAAGPSQTFCWSAGKARKLVAKDRFSIDICPETFDRLNDLLELCDSSSEHGDEWLTSNRNRICIYALKMLKLQLLASKACGLKPFESKAKGSSAELLKASIIRLCSAADVDMSVKSEAQSLLRMGWPLLLPFAFERVVALNSVLSDEDGATVANRKKFIFDVLTDSLLNTGGLDSAIDIAVKEYSIKSGRKMEEGTTERAVDVIGDFVELILKIITIDSLERLSENDIETTSQRSNFLFIEKNMCMLLRYQRLLFARLFKGDENASYWPSKGYYSELNPSIKAISILLKRYIQALVPCCKSLLKQGYEKVLNNSVSFARMANFLLLSVPGVILREFLVLLTMAQNFAPAVASTSEGVPLLGELLDNLDMFNRSSMSWQADDTEDLSWFSEGESKEVMESKQEKALRKISQEDLDQKTKEGNIWVAIHNKVYDLSLMKEEAPCGAMLIEYYAGKDATSVFDSMHHSDEALAMMNNYYIGDFHPNLNQSTTTLEREPLVQYSAATSFLDSQRTLALILGLHAGYLSCGVLVTSEELDKKKWMESQLFSGGVESSAVLKDISVMDQSNMPSTEKEFLLEHLLYDCELNRPLQQFLKNIKLIASQRDEIFSAIDFPQDHPMEKAVRAMLAATLMHLDLEKEAIVLSAMEIGEAGRQQEKSFVLENVSKKMIDLAFSVYRQKLKIFRAHQEQDKSYEAICDAVIEKCRFVFYCLHSASGIQKREQLFSEKQLTISRWQEAVQLLSVNEGTFWATEKWWTDKTLSEEEQQVASESRNQFDRSVLEQLLDFVCDENMILDVLRKCFLYQIKRVKQRLISGYMMQSYILRNGMIASARCCLLYGWMGMDCQNAITYRPKPGIANNIEMVSVEEFVKLKSVFDIIAHWAVKVLKKKVQKLASATASCKDANEARTVFLDYARSLTTLIGMLTSQCHIDNIEYLVHSGIFASIQCILSCLEKARSDDCSIIYPCPVAVVVDEARHHVTSIRNLTGVEMTKLMKFGTRVVRGPDWKWGDQDGPAPSQGRVISEVIGEDGWVRVQWDTSSTNSYRMGKDGKYDLKLAEPHIPLETTDDDNDMQDELHGQRDLKDQDLALSLLHGACITILQHTAILVCLKSSTIQERTVRIVSGLFMKIIKGAYLESNIALCNQNQDWITLGLLRLLCSSNRFCMALSQPHHITTLLNIVKKLVSNDSASGGSRASSVYVQILILKLLGNLLPCVSDSKNEPFVDSVVHQVVVVLGDMLVRHVDFAETESGGHHSSRRKHLQASVTASARGTVAEELIHVIRKLFSRPLWDKSISYVIEETLEKLARFFNAGSLASSDLPGHTMLLQDDAAIVAVLAIIGGADNRVRLGGMVENEEHGKGIVTRIAKSGKICVQSCDDERIIKHSPLSLWRVVETVRFDVDKMQNLSMMKEVLSSILHFAVLTREKCDAAKSGDNSSSKKEIAMESNLKSQQIELGLLVAARFLLPHSNILSSLLPHPNSVRDGGVYNCWIVEELFNAALKSNTVKSIYHRNEIETAALTLIEYLLATKSSYIESKVTSRKSERHLRPPKRPRRRRHSSTRLPNPPRVVQQIVEMGFSRNAVEKALAEMGDEYIRPEMIVTWLFDHPEITQDSGNDDPPSDIEIDLSNDNDSEAGSGYSESSSDSDCQVTASEIKPAYKTRDDFSTDEEYENYVLENVKVGASVRFKSSNDSRSEVGTVMNVFVYDLNKGSLEIQGTDSKIHQIEVSNDVELVKCQERRKIKVGDMVCVKSSVMSPKYKWGAVNHSNIGSVTSISPDGVECQVDFVQQSGWTGLVSEMELTGVAHTGISCDGCHSNPLCGPRFKCMTCFNFDLCAECFNEMGNHRHTFYRYDEPGNSPQMHGKPPKTKINENGSDGIALTNFKKCIKDIWLVPDIEWHSTGMELRKLYRLKSKQKTRICLEMNPGLRINKLTLSLDLSCPECFLTSAIVSAGTSMISMRKLATVRIDVSSSSVTLLENVEEEYKFVDIEINLCPACLVACKGNRLSMECTRKPPICAIPATFMKFIAKDCQEELDRKLQRPLFRGSLSLSQKPLSQRESKVFVWGLNDKEQLGGLKGSKVKTPVLSQALSSLDCHQIVGGSKTIFAVSSNGKAYACGESTNGRLGLGAVTGNIAFPRQMEGLATVFVKKIAVHSGSRHAMALTTDGRVYSWGEGEDGQLGHSNRLSYDSPKLIESFDGLTVIEIAAGSAHSAAIVSEGDLYTWGLGEYGRLGHGDTETQLKPKMVKVLFGKRVTQISCGSRDAQTLCLTDDGVVWSWGDGDFGKLGRGGSEGCLLPQKIERFNDANVCKVLCGAQFSLAITTQGIVYTWGKGDFYRLGHGNDSHVRRPHVVESLKGKKVIDVAVGALHCLAVTDEGEVYAWGDNDHGQQGNGTVAVNFRPAKVIGFDFYKITNVACGSSHSIAWAKLNIAPQMLFDPVPMKHAKDPLGMMYVGNELEQKKSEENVGQLMRRLRSSLSKYVLELKTVEEKKKSLDLVLESLRVCYARDALVKVLGDITRNAMEDANADDESKKTAECTKSNASPPAINGKEGQKEMGKGDVLSLANVKLLVSLLKLGFSERLNESQREELTMILMYNAKKDKEIAMTLLQECTVELEDVIANHELRKKELKPVTQDSPHPYQGVRKISGRIRIPGADSLRIEFDKNCSTEYSADFLSIMCGNGRTLALLSGSDPSRWTKIIKVTGDEVRWKFTAQEENNLWGWRFTVHPEANDYRKDLSCLSDSTALAVPSLELAKTFLNHDIEQLTGPGSHCNRLTFALSACAQLPSVSADDRCWIFRKLTNILVSDVGPPVDVSGLIGCGEYRDDIPNVFKYKSTGDTKTKEVISTSALGNLIRGLPDAIRKQYESEYKAGQHLFYSPFLRALVTLGRMLGLDYLMCCSDTYHWNWFTKYCMVHRVTESIIKRTPLPKDFLLDVRSRIQEISQGEEGLHTEHENHSLFTDEEDKQALNWLQRHPRDWFLSMRGNRNIYGWGHNHRGQLGGLDGSRIKSPQICDNLSSLHPVHICGGEQTLFCLSADGKIHSTGYGNGGRLGVGGMATITTPRVIESLQHVVVKKIAVHSGGKHCLALTSDGEIFSWGEGDDGKLGHGNRLSSERPRVIEKLLGTEIVDIACGGSHSAAISAAGELYTWGKGRYGRLGHGEGETEDQLEPKLVEALRGFKVTNVACGSGDAQTLCITDDDCVWSWGDGDFGKLGRGGSDGCKSPMRVDDLVGVGIVKVECGSQFSLALSNSGLVYTWGKGDYYRLGHGSDDHVRRPKVVSALEGKRVVSAACGSLHCVVCTDQGEVYTWGDNDEGQLGDGTTNAVHRPSLIQSLVGKKIDHVACGSAHTIAWSTAQTIEPCRLPQEIPSELTKLQNFSISTIRNRLLLLYEFSDMFWSALPLLDLHNNKDGSLFSERNIELLRSSLTSASKDSTFRKIINNTMVRDHQHGPIIDLNRVSVKSYRRNGGLAGRNGSKSVFAQACSKMGLLRSESLLLPHRVWKVKFIGESVDDCGGGYSESIAEMCEELQDGSLPLLIPTPDSRDEVEGVQKSFLLNPSARSQIHSDMFKFLGILIGIAIRTGSPLALNLAEPVWKQLSGASLSIEDIIEIDRGFLSRLNYVRELDLSDDGIDLPFTVLSSNNTEIQLLEKYSKISNENRNEYLKLVLQYRLHEFDQQVAAVREGMAKVVPVPLLVFYSGIELETMVCGSPHIPVGSLKAITSYKNIDVNEPLVVWFWEVIEEFTSLERSLFLRFVWGRARLPRTAADFRGRDFVFQVLDKFSPPNLYLPESYTCFFMLKMPRYTSKAILRDKLKYAIHFCKSIDSDEYARVDLTGDHVNT